MTGASNAIRQFDLQSGTELAAVTLATRGNLHYLAIRKGQLYAAALDDGRVYRYDIQADDALSFVDAIGVPSPIAVAFSEDEEEMFVSGHRDSSLISRFAFDPSSGSWLPIGEIQVGVSLGGLVMLPTRDP